MIKLFLPLVALFCCLEIDAQYSTSAEFTGSDPQITLYIVAQGYTTGTISEFESFVDGFSTALWATEPYQTYKQKFQVIKVYDYATTNTYPRAYNQFSPAYECTAGAATGSESYSTFKTRMDGIASSLGADDNDYFLAVFNSDFYSGGGGEYTFVTEYSCNAAFMYDVAIHEFSHSFGLLGDEYGPQAGQSVAPGDFPILEGRNITDQATLANIPWKHMIAGGTPIPTCSYLGSCSYTVTGLYEQANYANTGWYRPLNNCKMRSVSAVAPVAFCAVCQEIIKETIIKHLCVPSASISESFELRHTNLVHWRKASNTLTSTSVVGNEISLNFLAPDAVVLTNGFAAKSGCEFFAYTGSCAFIDIRNPYRPSGMDAAMTAGIESLLTRDVSLSLSPNPASDIINVNIDKDHIVGITLFSPEGKMLYSNVYYKDEINVSINVANYPKGMYVIEVKTDKHQKLFGKFIKQ